MKEPEPDPVVEAHLEILMTEIRRGAEPLAVLTHEADLMKTRYREDFGKKKNLDNWERDLPKIVVLSVAVGVLAAFFSRVQAVLGNKPLPTNVDDPSLYAAGFLMSRSFCPPPGSKAIRGKHCESYPPPGGLLLRILAWVLGVLFRLSGYRVTSGPLIVPS
jgi:hypothetical protein